jgi:pimeloyl-ACP methyl ester carboxylesterase
LPILTLDGVRIHYDTHGSGPPLLLLHGLGGSCGDWIYQLPAFSPRFRVVTPCLRGFGHSDRPPAGYSVDRHVRDVLALLDALDIDRCHVVGHSMGGAVAFAMALEAPARIASLVVLNSQPSFEVDSWRKRLFLLWRLVLARTLGMARMSRLMAGRHFPRPDQAQVREQVIERHGANDARAYIANLRALAGWTVVPRLKEIRAPVLLVTADRDFTAVEEKRRYLEQIPGARMEVIPDSRHVTHLDQPEAFNRAVLDFLGEVTGAPAQAPRR